MKWNAIDPNPAEEPEETPSGEAEAARAEKTGSVPTQTAEAQPAGPQTGGAQPAGAQTAGGEHARRRPLPGWLGLTGQTVGVAVGMFSALPVPRLVWNEKNMRWALCAFPLVGVFCGLAFGLWGWLAAAADLPVLLRAAGFCLLPVWITGGIHLDGYADTCDALASCGDREKRLAILKDPRCGAFAVIRLCSWFVLDFALCGALPLTVEAVTCMELGFVLSRAISGWAVAALPLAKNSGLAYTFSAAADRRKVKLILTGIILAVSMVLVGYGGASGWAMLAAALAALWRYALVSRREFGGITGDLAGWFLQRCELWMLAALVAVQLAGL